VVLQSNQWQVQTGVAVEEEEQWQVDGLGTTVNRVGCHLGVVGLLGLIEHQLRVQTPPDLVVFVNALTTDGQLNILDGTLGNPAP
jgi:hypothetical protein